MQRQPIQKTVKQILTLLTETPGMTNAEIKARLGRNVDHPASIARAQLRLQNHKDHIKVQQATPTPNTPQSDVNAAMALLSDALRKEGRRLVKVVVEVVTTEDILA